MSKLRKLLASIRNNPHDVRFDDLLRVLEAAGFVVDRTKGSHRSLCHPEHPTARLTLQPRNNRALHYQVKEALRLIDDNALEVD